MKLATYLPCFFSLASFVTAQSTAGLASLVARRMPAHINDFKFQIVNATSIGVTNSSYHDSYTVTSSPNGTISIHGTTISALSQGLHRYVADILHLDIYWFVGSRLYLAPSPLPAFNGTLRGSSVVPWRYHFNTGKVLRSYELPPHTVLTSSLVTFDYTAAWWDWEDWELELDWLGKYGAYILRNSADLC